MRKRKTSTKSPEMGTFLAYFSDPFDFTSIMLVRAEDRENAKKQAISALERSCLNPSFFMFSHVARLDFLELDTIRFNHLYQPGELNKLLRGGKK